MTDVWQWLIGVPLRIVIWLLAGVVVTAIIRYIIKRWTRHVVEGVPVMRRKPLRKIASTGLGEAIAAATPIESGRRIQRTRAIATVLRSAASIMVWTIVVIMVLAELGVNIVPLIASASVAGVAIGFGAQSLVKDFISGMFLLAEDQYGVGDVIDVGPASGTVEAVGLRVTKIRDATGTLWYVRNGEIVRVGNMTQGWSRAVVDVKIAYSESIERAERLLAEVAAEVAAVPELSSAVLADADITGAEDLSAEAVRLRVSIKTVPNRQWEVARELRTRIKERFQAERVTMA